MFPIQTVDFKLEDVEDEEVDELEDESDVAIFDSYLQKASISFSRTNQEIQDDNSY